MAEIIGQPVDRVDGRLKVTGRATYSAEHKVPNVAHAVLVVSPIAKGRIASIDTRAAEHAPGVLAVMTHLNTPKLPSPDEKDAAKKGSASRVVQAFQDDLVQYANQPVAAVVAETLEAANEGAMLVKIRYAAQRHKVSLEQGMPEAYVPEKSGGGGDPSTSSRGDMKAGLASGSASIKNVYSTPHEVHNAMEPHSTTAVWDSPSHLTLYDTTQGVFSTRNRMAKLFNLKPEDVHVISPFLGGGFGSKGPVWSHVVIAALAAQKVKRPVKLTLRRPQMFGPVGYRSETHQTLAAAAKSDGTLTALSNDTVSHTSTFDEFVEASTLTARMLYSVPNNSTSQTLVRSDIGTPSYTRAPGEAPGTFALECAMDEMAYAIKMDPLEFRIKNYADDDPEKKKPWSSKSLKECYRIGAERFGWSKRSPEPGSMRDGRYQIGYGMATAVYPTRRSASTAKARLQADGTLIVDAGTQDLGTGTYTIMTQVAAQNMGLPIERVKFRLGDTDYPQTPVSGGSQTAASTGSAVHFSTGALREKLISIATSDPQSPLSGAGAGDVVLQNGRLELKNNSLKGESFETLLGRKGLPFVEVSATAKPGPEHERYSMYAFGAQFAEVRVDADFGKVDVTRMVGVFGAGRILNEKTARNQLMGGMVWGISMALLEHGVMDERLGRFVNNNLSEYHVPVNLDVPAIEALWVKEEDLHVNPLGVKGIGEIGITGSSAAIANAVFHATGKRIRDLPITPDKLIVA